MRLRELPTAPACTSGPLVVGLERGRASPAAEKIDLHQPSTIAAIISCVRSPSPNSHCGYGCFSGDHARGAPSAGDLADADRYFPQRYYRPCRVVALAVCSGRVAHLALPGHCSYSVNEKNQATPSFPGLNPVIGEVGNCADRRRMNATHFSSTSVGKSDRSFGTAETRPIGFRHRGDDGIRRPLRLREGALWQQQSIGACRARSIALLSGFTTFCVFPPTFGKLLFNL